MGDGHLDEGYMCDEHLDEGYMCDGYLNDEELNNIMVSIENEGLVKVPDDLCDRVVTVISGMDCHVDPIDERRKRRKEYQRFRWRVWTAAAASLAILFLFPPTMSRPVPKAPSVVEQERESARMEKLQKLSGLLELILQLQNGGTEE